MHQRTISRYELKVVLPLAAQRATFKFVINLHKQQQHKQQQQLLSNIVTLTPLSKATIRKLESHFKLSVPLESYDSTLNYLSH